uniref:YukJ family protein n=1 Tax=Streptomyces sp. NBC_00049 TaxID=2903617 RepID=A0AAU2K0L2_9ACTN
MPFDHYGVLAGTLHRHFRDTPDMQGAWFHVNLRVDAPDGRYKCAVDVDSHDSATGVQWKSFTVDAAALGPVAALASGYHELARTSGSGALDYIRHPALRRHPALPSWLPARLRELVERWLKSSAPWKAGTNLDAALALEPILVVGRPILVFGEPFTAGLGMHNIHQNQGDPFGSQWYPENGIWQDGATMTRRPDGRYDVFLNKFSTQKDHTDDAGHPV